MPELAINSPLSPRVRVNLGELVQKFVGLVPHCERCKGDAQGRVLAQRRNGLTFYESVCPTCHPPADSAEETHRSSSTTTEAVRRRLRERERLHRRF